MKSNQVKVKRILFVRLGGIGDVIHTLPLVKYLRKKYNEASIEYITSPNVGELLIGCCPYIDKVWHFEKKRKKQLISEIINFRTRGKIDYFFNLHSSLSFFFYNLFYIKARRYFNFKKDLNVHAVVNFARTYDINLNSFDLEPYILSINGSCDLLEANDLQRRKYICFVVGVGNKRPHRAWPFENWLKLTRNFLGINPDFKVVFLGGKDEEGLAHSKQSGVINLIGKLNLVEVTKVISDAALLVSCDTGLLHIASALNITVIGLFGPTSPKRSGPFTENCIVIQSDDCKCIRRNKDVKTCKKTNNLNSYCMENLNFERVFSTIFSDNLKK